MLPENVVGETVVCYFYVSCCKHGCKILKYKTKMCYEERPGTEMKNLRVNSGIHRNCENVEILSCRCLVKSNRPKIG